MTDSHSRSLDSDPISLDSDSSMFEGGINPATGLPMMDSVIDVGGNMFGMSNGSSGIGIDDSMGTGIGMDDSMGIGTGIDSDIGIDSFGSSDDGFL
jgi:hypothetical protein